MIHTNRIVTVGEQESIIDRPIVLYRGDREVEIEFTLVGNEFTFSEEGNVIKSVNASHGQLVLNTPSGEHMFSELAECHEGKVVFVVTKEMIDEFIEMGFYSFQIRLYDSAEMKSRVTIPPVMNGFDIRNPIAAEDETNVADLGVVDYSRVGKDEWEEELPTFDYQGNYNKTDWQHHDVIYTNKLNKIEDALYSINANVIRSDEVMLNTLDQVKKDADAYVKEYMAEVEAEVDEFERNLNTDVGTFKVDVNAAMTAHKNEVSEELDGFSGEINYLLDMENNKPIEIESLRSEGISDDDLIDLAIQQVVSGNRKCIKLSARTYNVSRSHTIENSVNKSLIKGISIIGEGYGTVINCMSDIIEGVFNFKIPSNQQNVVISNIRFEFNGFNVLGVNFSEGGQLFRAENLIFLNTPARNGIGLKTGFNTTINNVVIEKIYCHNLNTGLEVSCDAAIIDKCIIRSCNNGIIGGEAFMAAASSINILNTEIAQCINSIYYSGKTTIFPLVINIDNCRIESSEGYDIYLEGYDNNNYRCRNINIKGCYITNVGKKSKGIELHRSLGCTIIGNLFKDFDTSPVKITTMQECWGMANTTIGGNTIGVFSSGISLINLLQNSFTNGTNFGTEFRSFVKVGDLTTLPKAASEYRGRIIRVNAQSDDDSDKIYICKKMAGTGVYEWVEL